MFTFVLLIYFCVIHIESYFIYLPSVNFTINNSTYAPKKHKLISERDTSYYLLLTTYYLLPTTYYLLPYTHSKTHLASILPWRMQKQDFRQTTKSSEKGIFLFQLESRSAQRILAALKAGIFNKSAANYIFAVVKYG